MWTRPVRTTSRRLTPIIERTALPHLISLDLETTGLDPERHQAWEVGLVDLRDNAEYWFEFPVRNLRDAEAGALRVNDYYENNSVPEGVDWGLATGVAASPDAPNTNATGYKLDTLAYLLARLTTGKTLLGAAVHFDARFLGDLIRYYGSAPAWSHRFLDLGSWAAGVLGYDRPLSTNELAGSVVPNDDAHSALGDARWNVDVYRNLIARRENR